MKRSGMSKKELKPIPHFKNEDEERAFWGTHDSMDYVDWSKATCVHFPNLELSSPEEPARAAETPDAKDNAAAD